MKHAVLILRLTLLSLLMSGRVWAQAPDGIISGLVADATGARIRAARVVVLSKETGLKRPVPTSSAGEFVVAALPPGRYEVTADAEGFKQLVREATVEAGSTTDVNLVMQVGASTTSVTVESASPQMQYESHEVNGRI